MQHGLCTGQQADGGEERRACSRGAATLRPSDWESNSVEGSDSDGLPPLQTNSNRRTIEWVDSGSESEASEQGTKANGVVQT